MDDLNQFREAFKNLTGKAEGPFPWQEALYLKWFSQEKVPSVCQVPTGLGKTSVIALWFIARAKLPRRLVYVVNRRTVVDQTTTEVENLIKNGKAKGLFDDDFISVSTLRGQRADDRAWSADPSRHAIIVGTVDMIGSRLLFSGYGVGFRARPLHAGFLGQDALIIHDEAHLEPAFQDLLKSIVEEQRRSKSPARFEVMEMSATTREDDSPSHDRCTLTEADYEHPEVKRRLQAPKRLELEPLEDEKLLPAKLVEFACQFKPEPAAILIFARAVEDVQKISDLLTNEKNGIPKDAVLTLTGTLRGLERDKIVKEPVFQRFLPEKSRIINVQPTPGAVFLVCTSAGEVGIDISADHMICDLSTFESMVQRLGRVNRRGVREDTRVIVVHPKKIDEERPFGIQFAATLKLLKFLNGDASPRAIFDLRLLKDLPCRVEDAFSPGPVILPATDILFDAWALTSIRAPLPGRPPVERYLHGIEEWQPPETEVAWRSEVEIVKGDLLESHPPGDLLDDYPLLPHEVLRDRSDRIFKQLQILAKESPKEPAWLIDGRNEVDPTNLKDLATQGKEAIEGKILLLPPSAGGLRDGRFDGTSRTATDVADEPPDGGPIRRKRILDGDAPPPNLRIIRTIEVPSTDKPEAEDEDADEPERKTLWLWYDSPRGGGRTAIKDVEWDTHVGNVVEVSERIVRGLDIPPEIATAVIVAARFHDHGKKRQRFQLSLGNADYPRRVLAKSGKRVTLSLPEASRHEFASVLDAQEQQEIMSLEPEVRDLVLHLIAAHHGRARPHFEPKEADDSEHTISEAQTLALETPRRFARLQRKYGRWGLAYIESLLRAADWAASACESECAK